MSDEPIYASSDSLRTFVQELFVKLGMPPQDSEIEADVLLWANELWRHAIKSRAKSRFRGGKRAGEPGRGGNSEGARRRPQRVFFFAKAAEKLFARQFLCALFPPFRPVFALFFRVFGPINDVSPCFFTSGLDNSPLLLLNNSHGP